MRVTLERELLEKLGRRSCMGIVRDEDVYVVKLVKKKGGNFMFNVKTTLLSEKKESYDRLAIRDEEEVILGDDLFNLFGGILPFRYALGGKPVKKTKQYTREEKKEMYSSKRNKIIDKILQTEKKIKVFKGLYEELGLSN